VLDEELLVFVVEGGELLDAGEDAIERVRGGVYTGEFEGMMMKLLIDGFANAGRFREITASFHVVNGIENFLALADKAEGSPVGTEALKGHVVDVQSEAVRRRSGDSLPEFADAGVLCHPIAELVLLRGGELAEEGIGALLAARGLEGECLLFVRGVWRNRRELLRGWMGRRCTHDIIVNHVFGFVFILFHKILMLNVLGRKSGAMVIVNSC
jgi:hypothetical protein